MRTFSFGIIATALLLALNSTAQRYTKEQTKSLEQEAISIKKDTTVLVFGNETTENSFDLVVRRAFVSADSLLVFVLSKKQDKTLTYESTVLPFLEAKYSELDIKMYRFDEDEELLYDSFLRVLKWERAVEIVNLYLDFILKNTIKLEAVQSILIVLTFIKYLYCYTSSKKETTPEWSSYGCIAKNFKDNNEVDWQVFALNPSRLLFWTFATCAWENATKK